MEKETIKKTYIGTYKVVKIFNNSGRRKVLRRGLTREEAESMINRYKTTSKSIVVFYEQFYADKYFV